MTKADLVAYVRTLADDIVQPYLTSDKALNSYIDEAEREAAERALYLRLDSSYDISVIAGTATYEIIDLIVAINRAKLLGPDKPLIKTTRRELDFNLHQWEEKSGTPKYYFLEGLNLTLYPLPDANFTLLLDGSRFPESSMETPSRHHESLAYWCLYRIYSGRDADVSNPGLANLNLNQFSKVFGHKRSAQFETVNANASEISPLYLNNFA